MRVGHAHHWRRYRALYLLLAVTLAPVIASYFAFYVWRPSARMNYGSLVEPLRPLPPLAAVTLDGKPFDFTRLNGRWTIVMADGGACDARCAAKLFFMRQQRTMTGKDRERIERLWLVTDDRPVRDDVLRDYEGTHIVRAPHADVAEFLAPTGVGTTLADHLWMIDPMGNLMLRWPADAEPGGVQRDIARLLTTSRHWVRIERKP